MEDPQAMINADNDGENAAPAAAASEEASSDLPQVATPEDAAAAAAEVLALEQNTRNRRRDPTGDQALMGATGTDAGAVGAFEVVDESGELVRQAFLQFLTDYRQEVQRDEPEEDDDEGNEVPSTATTYIRPYQEQADNMAFLQLAKRSATDAGERAAGLENTLLVNFSHILRHDPELADAIQGEFARFEPYLRKAVQEFVLSRHPELDDPSSNATAQNAQDTTYFIAMHNIPSTVSIRRLKTDLIGSLSSVTATVTRTSDVRPELLVASFRCNKCGLLADKIPQQYHYTRPTLCRNPRCKNKSPQQFTLETKQSEFVDWQKLRVQENSNQIPPGSMPRSMDVVVRNEMVERCKAGDKCVFVGTLVVLPDGSALARAGEAPQSVKSRPSDAATGGGGGVSGLQALGVRELTYRTCFVATSVLPAETLHQANQNEQVMASFLFGKQSNSSSNSEEPTPDEVIMEYTAAQQEEIRQMRASPNLYDQMVESIAPNTFGHKEVKKGILLMLLGGVHKTTPDGIKLRGDINVCVVGDPSVAKSQFLKFVHSFLPSRAVYTSGKASSAAGLTAAVQRDQDTGEFCIEAGALMLADNGICCIDEFDKMDPTDQVAIHEAMEQQTISITKAGIQATLNARASILAAANPIYGRYDRSKTLKANVALSAPILSRFDLFFVVLDDCNPEADRQVAKHILSVHRNEEQAVNPPFNKDQMRRYIRFVRTLHPKITPESQRVMVDCYRKLRQGDTLGRSRSAYRITVRQLESMIRLSEALARLYCDDEIQPKYVREAFRLLKTSIIQVETSDVDLEDEDEDEQMQNAEEQEDEDMEDSQEQTETQQFETQQHQPVYPGEYAGGEDEAGPSESQNEEANEGQTEEPKKKKKKKKKTKMSFEEYEAMANAIAGHLRAIEGDGGDNAQNLTWQQVQDWYLEQVEQEIGDSMEKLEEMRRKVNLVIRRLLHTDHVLVTVGDVPSKKEELNTLLAVHPNYEVS